MKSIVCFGDSNTWGYNPDNGARYPFDTRWTGLLQTRLGPSWRLIEEGLNGRTTDIEYPDRPPRAGLPYLRGCLDSHSPIDYVILNLGTNDFKIGFDRSPAKIATSLESLVKIILGHGIERPSPDVKIILVAPPRVIEGVGSFAEDFIGAGEKSAEYPEHVALLAAKYKCMFVNLFGTVEPSAVDGVHLSKDSHVKIADLFYERLTSVDHI